MPLQLISDEVEYVGEGYSFPSFPHLMSVYSMDMFTTIESIVTGKNTL